MSGALLAPPIPLEVPLGGALDRPRILALEAKRSLTSAVLGGLAPLVAGGRALFCVDGGNGFDPYVFSVHARRWGMDPEPLLGRVWITRTFTIHQLEAVVALMLRPLAQREPPPLVAVLGLDHLFLEESLPLWERRQVLERIARRLRRLRDEGMTMLVTHDPPSHGRDWWRPLVRGLGDWRGSAREGADGRVEVTVETSSRCGTDTPVSGGGITGKSACATPSARGARRWAGR